MKPCPHVTLKRINWTTEHPHWECAECRQKFLIEEWDGKWVVVEPTGKKAS